MVKLTHQYIDLNSLKENTFNDVSIMKEIMVLFLDIIDEYVEVLTNEIDNRNWEELYKATHKIKPNVNMFGISSLESTILELESNFKNEENLDNISETTRFVLSAFKDIRKEVELELKSMDNE